MAMLLNTFMHLYTIVLQCDCILSCSEKLKIKIITQDKSLNGTANNNGLTSIGSDTSVDIDNIESQTQQQ